MWALGLHVTFSTPCSQIPAVEEEPGAPQCHLPEPRLSSESAQVFLVVPVLRLCVDHPLPNPGCGTHPPPGGLALPKERVWLFAVWLVLENSPLSWYHPDSLFLCCSHIRAWRTAAGTAPFLWRTLPPCPLPRQTCSDVHFALCTLPESPAFRGPCLPPRLDHSQGERERKRETSSLRLPQAGKVAMYFPFLY